MLPAILLIANVQVVKQLDGAFSHPLVRVNFLRADLIDFRRRLTLALDSYLSYDFFWLGEDRSWPEWTCLLRHEVVFDRVHWPVISLIYLRELASLPKLCNLTLDVLLDEAKTLWVAMALRLVPARFNV